MRAGGLGVAGSLGHFTALRDAVADRPPCPALADALAGRSNALREMRQIPEAAADARRALAVAREIGYPVGELLALAGLSGPPPSPATMTTRYS